MRVFGDFIKIKTANLIGGLNSAYVIAPYALHYMDLPGYLQDKIKSLFVRVYFLY